MSNIPSSAMPHAGGQSNTSDTSSGSSTSGQFSSGQSGSTSGDATNGQFSAGQGASTSGGSSSGQFSGQSTSTTTGTSQYQPSSQSQSQSSQYQPQSYSSASSYQSGETLQRTRRRDTVMEKARDNKTGLAIGIVGAAAAAAIPFLLSKRSKSKEQHREFPVRVDNRTQASGSYSERDSFTSKDDFSSDDSFSAKNRGNKNNY